MAELPIPLNPDERVLLDSESVYPRTSLLGFGHNPIFGHLWLTNQRLVFRGMLLGQLLILPLSRVTEAAPSDRQIKTSGVSMGGFAAFMSTSTLMVVSFDNGGREYFAVKDLAGWSDAILSARTQALPMEYTSMPSRRPGVEAGMKDLLFWFGGAVGLMCLGSMCCGGLIYTLPYILPLLRLGQ